MTTTAGATRIVEVLEAPLHARLAEPFTVATARVERLANRALGVVLADGTTGWGEVAVFPPITHETGEHLAALLAAAGAVLLGADAACWRSRAADLAEALGPATGVRAACEMAIIDALARRAGTPLWKWFGGAAARVESDVTLPIADVEVARGRALGWRARGFRTFKVKVGRDVALDVARITAVAAAVPGAQFVLDANGGYAAAEALALLAGLEAAGIVPVLFEQPLHRDDSDGARTLAAATRVPVAADESCRSAAEVLELARDRRAAVVNVKLAKCGVVEALAVVACARAAGLGLMMGGMVETRLGMGFAAHFAAGLGGFEFIDLDTAWLLDDDPVQGGAVGAGPWHDLGAVAAGHGMQPATRVTACAGTAPPAPRERTHSP